MAKPFRFKQFEVLHEKAAQKVTTDSVVLGSWFIPRPDTRRILDVGAGCGVLALMAAQKCPHATVDAVEIEPSAAHEASQNFSNSPWGERMRIEVADFAIWEPVGQYDVVLCNPPYFSETTYSPDANRKLARHETSLNVESLITKGSGMLTPDGSLFLVCRHMQLGKTMLAAELAHLGCMRLCEVVSVEGLEPSLCLLEFSHRDSSLTKERLVIRDAENRYTDQYIELTKDFYLFLH